MIETLKKITGNNLHFLKWPMICAGLEGIFIAAPYAIVAFILPATLRNTMSRSLFWWLFILLLVIIVLRAILSRQSYGGGMVAGYRAGTAIRFHLGEHLRKLPMGFFLKSNTGELANRLFFNVSNVEMMISHFLPQAITNVCTPLAVFIILVTMSPDMALMAAAPLFLAVPILWGLIWLVGQEGGKRMVMIDNVNNHILEYLHGLTVLKAFNMTGTGFTRLDKALKDFRSFSLRFEIKGWAISMTYSAILEMGFVALLFTGITLVRREVLDVPEMIIFLVVSLRFYRPLLRFAENAALTRAYYSGAKAIEHVFNQTQISGSDKRALNNFTITFDKVGFAYESHEVIRDVSFSVSACSMTALVGPSGSGKSTLARLIARFWDVDRGCIYIGDRDIKSMEPEALLNHISMVFQDVYLFKDTIVNNIRFGMENASMEEVIAVAKEAQCHDFIASLPNGYDTIIGEGGTTLSGGEKQRISIARAMLKDAPIVLLDEATASLDPENDRQVQLAIDRLVKSKTLIVIAHRLQTITSADQIVVLEEGRVVQKGKHKELLLQQGRYARMWREQQHSAGFQTSKR